MTLAWGTNQTIPLLTVNGYNSQLLYSYPSLVHVHLFGQVADMSFSVPNALLLDEKTGQYAATDAVTSGGDIGAQVPIFPVVWVRAALLSTVLRKRV